MKGSCPHCKTVLSVGPEFAGKTGKCPACGSAFQIPENSFAKISDTVRSNQSVNHPSPGDSRISEGNELRSESDRQEIQSEVKEKTLKKKNRTGKGRSPIIPKKIFFFLAIVGSVIGLVAMGLISGDPVTEGPRQSEAQVPPGRKPDPTRAASEIRELLRETGYDAARKLAERKRWLRREDVRAIFSAYETAHLDELGDDYIKHSLAWSYDLETLQVPPEYELQVDRDIFGDVIHREIIEKHPGFNIDDVRGAYLVLLVRNDLLTTPVIFRGYIGAKEESGKAAGVIMDLLQGRSLNKARSLSMSCSTAPGRSEKESGFLKLHGRGFSSGGYPTIDGNVMVDRNEESFRYRELLGQLVSIQDSETGKFGIVSDFNDPVAPAIYKSFDVRGNYIVADTTDGKVVFNESGYRFFEAEPAAKIQFVGEHFVLGDFQSGRRIIDLRDGRAILENVDSVEEVESDFQKENDKGWDLLFAVETKGGTGIFDASFNELAPPEYNQYLKIGRMLVLLSDGKADYLDRLERTHVQTGCQKFSFDPAFGLRFSGENDVQIVNPVTAQVFNDGAVNTYHVGKVTFISVLGSGGANEFWKRSATSKLVTFKDQNGKHQAASVPDYSLIEFKDKDGQEFGAVGEPKQMGNMVWMPFLEKRGGFAIVESGFSRLEFVRARSEPVKAGETLLFLEALEGSGGIMVDRNKAKVVVGLDDINRESLRSRYGPFIAKRNNAKWGTIKPNGSNNLEFVWDNIEPMDDKRSFLKITMGEHSFEFPKSGYLGSKQWVRSGDKFLMLDSQKMEVLTEVDEVYTEIKSSPLTIVRTGDDWNIWSTKYDTNFFSRGYSWIFQFNQKRKRYFAARELGHRQWTYDVFLLDDYTYTGSRAAAAAGVAAKIGYSKQGSSIDWDKDIEGGKLWTHYWPSATQGERKTVSEAFRKFVLSKYRK